MQSHVQQYYDQGIYSFTFEGITADTNDKGKVVKKAMAFQIGKASIEQILWNIPSTITVHWL